VPGKQPVYRQRRFPPLPVWLKVALAVGWLAAAALTFWLVDSWTARIGFLVVATMLLPLVVVLVRDPTRRTR
jgi:peptidoglycan/LPS O-acetylase OafA/YrhL